MTTTTTLFEEVCSTNFLEFSFGGRSYSDQIKDAVVKTKKFCAVEVKLEDGVVWCRHDFGFLGGSLGCAEGEKVTRAFEYATKHKLPIVVACKTGGARMQEGTLSLMQMAKVSVAVEAHRGLPFISVLEDPTYGGVSASYAMQADIRVAASGARIGFAGPGVILNTMFEMNQERYDEACPAEFQSAEYCKRNGAVDVATDDPKGAVLKILGLLTAKSGDLPKPEATPVTEEEKEKMPDYAVSRSMKRPQFGDVLDVLFSDFVELSGDGQVGSDSCIKGGLARFGDERTVVVIGCQKGHTPGDMQAANYGMPSPAGYRTAKRLMGLAERFGLPVITFVDTCGAWPSFPAENSGQSEAIATNLTVMAGLKVPMITVVLGEGGSGGALGVAMGNAVGMLSQAYYGVISPEGAASILGRYESDAHKMQQFPKDCYALATAQSIYAYQLRDLGVVDHVIYEKDSESFSNFPETAGRICSFITTNLKKFESYSPSDLVSQRYEKYRALGKFLELSDRVVPEEGGSTRKKSRIPKPDATPPSKLTKYLAREVLHTERPRSKYPKAPREAPEPPAVVKGGPTVNAKSVLDAAGPEAAAKWVRDQPQVLITDTTMRDAHQSLLATRVRTLDLVKGASVASQLLSKAFSFECWGGATFDVAYRFLFEDPWDRLEEIRRAAPNVCTQMLFRGSNAVGYTSYPDNVVTEFVRLASKNMDVFRIFDCFNDVEQMRVAIQAVRDNGKIAECCVCYTSDISTSKVYDVEYYKNVTKSLIEAGAHIVGVKDMAGLMKPAAAEVLVKAIRSISNDVPIHFHTHATSSVSLAVAMEMARCGCDIIDFAVASMADLTSQPSLNAFCAAMDGLPRSPGISYMSLEPLDMYWMRVREMYSPFETGMLAGSARVFDHEIPGGQYANLFVQCQSMGLGDRWEDVLDMYRDVNDLFGDIIKVTPSSKCVGDLALFLINKNLKKASDVLTMDNIDYPDSVVGLMEGRLGFPHRGFPKNVQAKILKGKTPLTERPSAVLPPADFDKIRSELGVDEYRAMSAILYPKVFADYQKFCAEKTELAHLIPTPVFWHSFEIGQSIRVKGEKITLTRVGPVKAGRMRTIVFDVDGREQRVEVKSPASEGEFDGPMADASNPNHVPSPMPGAVDKVLVKEGDSVEQGQEIFVVSAMKMEVKVKAPKSALLKSLFVSEGDKIVEGALMAELLLL
ncbi:hypothetical protein CTAYLR_008844 [Chrysophaeum taylorii]|uniref:acetyl-CoA carboxytransferase n=1 Tax=Chrysophaeum taylorii TaxID=2483200 RepID=A0AAD7U6P5_9STRA|nr:hypothetical protein CTAYLR_008844 [Chrysophaeum taylorii]